MHNGSTNLALSSTKFEFGLALISCGGRYKVLLLVALASLADWLFYGHPFGASCILFLLALELGVVAVNPIHATSRDCLTAAGVFVAAAAPLLVETGLYGVLLAAMGAACAALMVTRTGTSTAQKIVGSICLLVTGWRIVPDCLNGLGRWTRGEGMSASGKALTVWIVPILLGLIFLWLFTSANPLIEDWVASLDLGAWLAKVDGDRVLFWLVVTAFVWPFIAMRIPHRMRTKADLSLVSADAPVTPFGLPPQIFGKAAILRSLVLFNLLFAVQTMLDGAYLWGGVTLPHGMSYAAYAHRGAYPLVVTALLAAAFVIAAMKPGSEAAGSRLIRTLVFLWTGQNVVLVISSILRLDLYVEVYSLTYLRIAAFTWMLLVTVGLVLIVARIALGRSNGWLVRANFLSLALTLYVCLFANFPDMVATYNVQHSREISGTGAVLDLPYLMDLGPQAIPALDRYAETHSVPLALVTCRNNLAAAHLKRMEDWRAWSYRDWQLARYLRTKPVLPTGAALPLNATPAVHGDDSAAQPSPP